MGNTSFWTNGLQYDKSLRSVMHMAAQWYDQPPEQTWHPRLQWTSVIDNNLQVLSHVNLQTIKCLCVIDSTDYILNFQFHNLCLLLRTFSENKSNIITDICVYIYCLSFYFLLAPSALCCFLSFWLPLLG
jgi:hypothetical protein